MNDEQMQPLLEAWFRDTDPTPPDTRQTAVQVMARVPQTHQRGRWWPLLVFHRKAQTATATDATEIQPSAIPNTNGHAPTVIGRTQTMFSLFKAITAGAIVFALGGVLLIAQPFDQQGNAPGAEQGAEPMAPVRVTITESDGTDVPEECTTTPIGDDYGTCTRGSSGQFSATDPRLSGTATYRLNEHYWGAAYPLAVLEAVTIEIVNDEGAWVGTGRAFGQLEDLPLTFTLTGEGAYEGLVAFVTEGPEEEGDEEGLKGVIIGEGDLPPFPEPAE